MLIDHPNGNYSFLKGIAPYSAGVVAKAGFEIIHSTFAKLVPLDEGFEIILRHLQERGRTIHALCAIELRLPAPVSFKEFAAFNTEYRKKLIHYDLLLENVNPLARTNIAPAASPSAQPGIYGFSYTKPTTDPPSTFVVAGAGDLKNQADLSPKSIVRPGETKPDAMLDKASTVVRVMSDRLHGLGVEWNQVTCTNIYTILPLQLFLKESILNTVEKAGSHGVHWHYSRPPIEGLDFEMDVRGVRQEIWLHPKLS